MRGPLLWLKMWSEWIHNPKMLALSWAEVGQWWGVVTLAHACGAEGPLVKGDGSPMTLNEIAKCLHISSKKDMKTLGAMIQKMEAQGSLSWDRNILTVVNLKERQAMTPSATREAVRERVRRHRQSREETKNPVPPSIPPTTKDKDKEVEVEGESNGVTPVTPEAILAEISQLYEKNFGILTPILAEKFKDFAENYTGPLEWIHDAFEESCAQNVRKWSYVEKILETCQAEGRKPRGKEKQQRKDTGPGAYRQGDREPTAKELRESLER